MTGSESDGDVFRAEVDTSAPFESVMEAVSRFGGGISCRKHHSTLNPSQPTSQTMSERVSGAREEEREIHEILKEIEATKTRFEELKVKLMKIKTYPSDENTTQFDGESKVGILEKVEEATQQVNKCTKVLEEALSASTEFKKNNTNVMSIGQILTRKLVLAEKENCHKSCVRWKASLPLILRKATFGEKTRGRACSCGCGRGRRCDGGGENGTPAKRMRFGFCV